MPVYSKKQAQIEILLFDKAPIEVLAEYSNYSNVFLAKNLLELSKHTRINNHAVELKEYKQPLLRLIYSLGLVELETLKTYIETNLENCFIWPSKSPVGAPILFDSKPDRSLRLYINYWGFNNIIIKNRHPLSLIDNLLDGLGQAKRFTQLDLINAYYQRKICKSGKQKIVFQI